MGKFTIKELENALVKIDNGKTPGTDGIPGEFLKWLNTKDAIEIILDLINDIWELETIPTECEIARVVIIIKKQTPISRKTIDQYPSYKAYIRSMQD